MIGHRTTIALAVLLGAIGCSEPGPTPIDTAPDTTFHYSAETAVAIFGRYRVDPTLDSPPTATPDGEFVSLGSSPSGHRVGRVGTRLAIWPLAASAPTYMFRADTTIGSFKLFVISDRLEVVLVTDQGFNTQYAWYGGELRQIKVGACINGISIGVRGMIGGTSQCSLYSQGSVAFSPFNPDQTRSGRFGGGASCKYGGRYSRVDAIDDENDFVEYGETSLSPTTAAWKLNGGASSCTDIPWFGNKNVQWTSIRAGLVGGTNHASTLGPATGLLTDGVHVAKLNDLLVSASAAEWDVQAVRRIGPGRSLTCDAVSRMDGHKATIKLVPAS